MNSEESVFSFELNETLFFEKGQEVAEIRGISLDPNISIQSFNEYISIRGVVELQGEYERSVSVNDEELHSSSSLFDHDQAYRYIERVVDVDHSISEFSHRFPVEISVPSYRVNNLDDVMVQITSFDYELPDESKLKLMSTIEIHGINDQIRESNLVEEDEKEEVEETNRDNKAGTEEGLAAEVENETESTQDIEETFEFEIKKEDVGEKERETTTNEETDNSEKLETNLESVEEKESFTAGDNKDEKDDRWKWGKKKKSQSIAEFFEKDLSVESSSYPSSSENIASFESPSESYEMMSSSRDIDSSSSEDNTDLSYLTGMFRAEEETYTQMRLYIVQEKDTLESIAERYDTTSMHITNKNGLTEDDVSEGQLLYIPYKKNKS
ncbi:MAG TPA: stage VI sporulation protein D [Candidatus Avamphibacillus sp.]|nr:stage VI sporulation protein D [Candidatus Avamphibacillus sp.]